MNLQTFFVSDPARHDGVRPVHIACLRLIYLLMSGLMALTAWTTILEHQGDWEPYRAMAACVWAAYGTLSLFGLLHPLRMLPVVLFMIFYKTLWLAVVAYPLWQAGRLTGSTAEELTYIFLAAPAFALVIPWGYVLRRYVLLPKPGAAQSNTGKSTTSTSLRAE